MGDHFVLLVNKMYTESSIDDAVPLVISDAGGDCSSHKIDFAGEFSALEMVECRICQDEDFDSNMEVPCSCRGSMKYAHRKCVQRWCNEKGDTLCEICHQEFEPGYIVSQALFQFGAIPMNFRGNWEISRRRFGNPGLIAMVSTDCNFHDPEDDDENAVSASRSMMCCRSLAVILMILLVILVSCNFGQLLLLRTAGVIFPIYVMLSRSSGPAPAAPAPTGGYEHFIKRRHCAAAHRATSSRRYSPSLNDYPSYTYIPDLIPG